MRRMYEYNKQESNWNRKRDDETERCSYAVVAVINEIIAVIAAKKGFELAGKIHAGNP